MTSETCTNCDGKLEPTEKVQVLVADAHAKYWYLVTLYKCVDCELLHIVDTP